MKDLHFETVIAADQHQVFQAATDVRRWPEMMPQITATHLLDDGPVGVGTRFTETRKVFGREATEEMKFTRFDPPRMYVVQAESGGALYTSTFTFQALGNRQTKVTLDFTAKPMGVMAKIVAVVMAPLIRKTMTQCMQQDLESLRLSMEETPSSDVNSR
jgi:ribosome-associated toxin RatA of RatAB toxin-antitoxin module